MALAHCVFGIDNRCGLKLIVTLISNFMMTFSIQLRPPKANTNAGEKYRFAASKSSIKADLVYGRRHLY